ncbi:MAG: MBL fold metallo-hydrolase [Pseudomonadota bacterium]|jgi:flavorubredoxin|nr:MBL fold metallo-hydrolase [Pseudomonadota bacterium]
MKATILYEDGDHRWIMFGRDPGTSDTIVDTNQYLIQSGDEAILLDPGGTELFAPMLSAVLKYVPAEQLTRLFASHQDPDIISSLGLWDQALDHATLYAPDIWEGFIRHFGMTRTRYHAIPDEGMSLTLGRITLQFVPAHYLHSPGNFHVWDAKAGILMSGNVGGTMEGKGAPIWVEDLDRHLPKMARFHQRWMPSEPAKQDWIRRVSGLGIKIMAPQHGSLLKGAQVDGFLRWFEQLKIGSAVGSSLR